MYQHIDLYVNEYSVDPEAKDGAPWSCSSTEPGRWALFLRSSSRSFLTADTHAREVTGARCAARSRRGVAGLVRSRASRSHDVDSRSLSDLYRRAAASATARRFPLTPLAYRLIFVHALILMLGGHYTYAQVRSGSGCSAYSASRGIITIA